MDRWTEGSSGGPLRPSDANLRGSTSAPIWWPTPTFRGYSNPLSRALCIFAACSPPSRRPPRPPVSISEVDLGPSLPPSRPVLSLKTPCHPNNTTPYLTIALPCGRMNLDGNTNQGRHPPCVFTERRTRTLTHLFDPDRALVPWRNERLITA